MTPSRLLKTQPSATTQDLILHHILDMQHTLGAVNGTLHTLQAEVTTLSKKVSHQDHQLSYWKGGLAAGLGLVAMVSTLVGYVLHA